MSKPILVGNKIKPTRKPTRTERIYGTEYVFSDRNGDGHFITEVTNPRDAELMLGQPDHFYAYPPNQPRITRTADPEAEQKRLDEIAAKARADAEAQALADAQAASDAAAAAELADKAKTSTENADLADAVSNADDALVDEAKKFLELDPKKMAAASQKASGLPVLKVALALETAGQNRPAVVKVLNDVLAVAPPSGNAS